MANIKRSSIVGFHNIKNKVSRNAFDLSHRHMFTAQIGELLPIFVQWVNPNETFKLGFNGFTRTQPLQTAAFTRLRENVQYYFVPFQSLWKYFEQQVNNMTTGQSGENISRIALSATEDSPITTKMPYINADFIRIMFNEHMNSLYSALVGNFASKKGTTLTIQEVFDFLKSKGDLYLTNESLRYATSAKLLRAFGYLNTDADNYDVVSNFILWHNSNPSSYTALGFRDSQYGLTFNYANYVSLDNAPNLSIFPLLAYQKIVNDHYLYRQWQPYKSYACNIDYLLPTDSMNFSTKLGNTPLNNELFTLQYSNLPLDYFNGVLPKAQYGEESAASVDVGNLSGRISVSGTTSQPTYTSTSGVSPATHDGSLQVVGSGISVSGTGSSNPPYQTSIRNPHTHTLNANATGVLSADASLKISSLRSAIALQKYKEIQESNDSDFASQVLAHFGVKPNHDDYKSYFIGGGDSVIDINPQINQNLADGNDPDIKATGAGQLSCGCKFTSDTYGIIIGIYRCVPQLDLAHVGIDRNLFKTDASDFPIPELDRIGMQTQYRCEVVSPKLGTFVGKSDDYFDNNGNYDYSLTYGYLPRYAELKTSYDRYEGAFLDSLSSWVTGYTPTALDKWRKPTGKSGDIPIYDGIDELLKCRPSIVNSIFVDQTAFCCNNDKLLIGSVNTCVAIRPFSVYGLPYSK